MDYINKEIINLVEVSNKINFWMVRTKKGIFFDEYVKEKYIALGWNYITKTNVAMKTDKFKEDICKLYSCKTGTGIINKCNRFINEMENGDIVMVPSAHNTEILFARVGDYYESNHDCIKETELMISIDAKKYKDIIMECPYKKRRKIEIIKIVDGKRLNPNLYRALVSHHGISKINEYGIHILSSIYNFYTWKDELNFVINIEKKTGVNAKSYSKLIYDITDLLTFKNEEKIVVTRSNINSPGDLILSILNTGKEFIVDNWLPIFMIWGAISGIKFATIELNSFPEFILKMSEKRKDLKMKDMELEEKRLDIELKKYNLEEKRRLIEASQQIENATRVLEVDQSTSSNVLNVTQTDDV